MEERLIVIEIDDVMYELSSSFTDKKYEWNSKDGDLRTVTDLNDFTQEERLGSNPFEGPNKYSPFKDLAERIVSKFKGIILYYIPHYPNDSDSIY